MIFDGGDTHGLFCGGIMVNRVPFISHFFLTLAGIWVAIASTRCFGPTALLRQSRQRDELYLCTGSI